jgi:hypothetical protein
MKFFMMKLMALDEEDRYSIKEIFAMEEYKQLTYGDKMSTSVMYQSVKQNQH